MLSALVLAALAELKEGSWRAALTSAGGELPFTIEVERRDGALKAVLVNGSERIDVPALTITGDEVVFDITHYDSTLRAKLSDDGTRLSGEWSKRAGADRRAKLPFTAKLGDASRFASLGGGSSHAGDIDGRWSVRFWAESDPAVAIFHAASDGTVDGTFLTTTGDYRYLAGSIDGDRLRLSCFDGAHAFLFDAQLKDDGRIEGDFWSGDRWHDRWRATRDPNAALPDTFAGVKAADDFGLALLHFPDLDGKLRSLAEFQFGTRAIVLQVLGSWCPNCHDETAYLADFERRYRSRGVAVIGLAFEYSGEFERDATQVRRMRERHHVEYPILLAGSANKERAAQALPALDKVLAFPTTIFLHRDGTVRAVHSGFAGPGTGDEHARLAQQFESIVDELLAESVSDDSSAWSLLTGSAWSDTNDRSRVELARGDRVAVAGSSVRVGDEYWFLDRRAGVLLDGRDFGHRLLRSERLAPKPTNELSAATLAENRRTALALESADPFVRREALFSLADLAGMPELVADMHPERFMTDADPLVRCTAAWTCGRCGARQAGATLISALQSGYAPLRREAARALGLLKVAEAVEPLRALEHDIDPLVREAARKAAQRAGTR